MNRPIAVIDTDVLLLILDTANMASVRQRKAHVELTPEGPAIVVLGVSEDLERRARQTPDGVVVETWQRIATVALSADDVALLYAIAEDPKG